MSKSFSDTVSVIKRHVPEWEIGEWEAITLSPNWLLDTEMLNVAQHEEQSKNLKLLADSLLSALTAYRRLHPSLASSIETGFRENMKAQSPITELRTFLKVDGEWTPFLETKMLKLLLSTGVANLRGSDVDGEFSNVNVPNIGSDVVKLSHQALGSIKSPSHKQIASETWQKALLVARARRIWSEHKQKRPARKPSEGAAFFLFVDELIKAVGKDWSTESTFNAWMRHAEDMDRYGLTS